MRITHIQGSSISGGARIAMERIGNLGQGNTSKFLYLQHKTHPNKVLESIIGSYRYRIEESLFGWPQTFSIFRSMNRRSIDQLAQTTDLIHLHALHGSGLTLGDLKRLAKAVPTVWTIHDAGWLNILWRERHSDQNSKLTRYLLSIFKSLGNLILRLRVRHAVKDISIISPSRWLSSELIRHFSLRQDQVAVIPNPVPDIFLEFDVSRELCKKDLRIPTNIPVVTFAAWKAWKISGDQNKGYQQIAEMIRKLRTKYNFSFLLFGHEGQDVPSDLEAIWIRPDGSQKQILEVYRASDCVVGASLQECLPGVMQEAQALGTPCVAPGSTGYLDTILDGRTGLFFEPGKTADFLEKIGIILQDNNLANEMSKTARFSAKKSWGITTIG
ncbi:glycosyltransferase, partial [Pontimonas sp.]|nr:glycosyltransferase [Pontimonas sp.]